MARFRPRRAQLDSRAGLRRHAHRHRGPQPHRRTRRRRHGLWGGFAHEPVHEATSPVRPSSHC